MIGFLGLPCRRTAFAIVVGAKPESINRVRRVAEKCWPDLGFISVTANHCSSAIGVGLERVAGGVKSAARRRRSAGEIKLESPKIVCLA